MKLTLIRHAQSEYNKQGLFQGHIDSPLSEEGHIQSQELAEYLQHENYDIVYASDLSRSWQTAEYLSDEVIRDARLKERHFGSAQGRPKEEFPDFVFPDDSEPQEDVHARLQEFLDELRTTHHGKNVCLVMHGSVLRSMISLITGASRYELTHGTHIPNTSMTVIDLHGEPDVLFLGVDASEYSQSN